MSLHDWIAERPDPEAPDVDPAPYEHDCWRYSNGDCRACDAEQAAAEATS